ncbi:acetyl-CoA acetyltransferase A, mitochondrial-like [Dermatophagoides pteronyssinus]|uniref:acetyl-CoA C-acetyltransferase n=2 Tax=Dermatophagoides pteronyssinus TaxID=6956 RepID=A0A6P6XRV5_DERPT|nr:acetyl-CoA acetyltransferase A, mitochondrial-like [Dermatophagoides pteronyssinus]KAH9426486.1 Acetyl-CoA acetyltransferase, mitochondrial [Dermatophagoides pteronyssinus]
MSPAKKEVYIVAAKRTPLGSFQGSLSSLSATKLGSIAIHACLEDIGLSGNDIDEVIMGNVLQANIGQAPARQASLGAGIINTAPCTTVNKVCASGMKALMFGTQSIMLGDNDIVITGGFESMSNVPYYLSRGNTPYGGVNLVDGVVRDGLTDAYDQIHMGVCTENLAQTFNITREETDEFARQSYQRAAKARDTGIHAKEIVPVIIPGRKGKPDVTVTDDEEIGKVNFDKIPYLNPVFRKDGTITAANASSLNDGAAACILMSETALSKYDYQPMAKVIGFADAAIEPKDFGIAPAYAIEKLLKKTGISKSQIAHWELNEAFSTVGLANIKKLGLEPSKVNPYGGAVSMGHPLGCSGARIVNILAHHLNPEEFGLAAICNGGGGASAVLIQKL